MKKGMTNLMYFSGLILAVIGALGKLQQWPYHNVLLITGASLYIIALLIKQQIIGTRL